MVALLGALALAGASASPAAVHASAPVGPTGGEATAPPDVGSSAPAGGTDEGESAAYHPSTVVVGLARGVEADEVAGLDRVGEVVTVLEALDVAVLRVPAGTVDEAIAALAGLSGVAYAERNVALPLADEPNDPRRDEQYALSRTEAVEGWTAYNDEVHPDDAYAATGGPAIAVVDSGIDRAHPEFQGKVSECESWMTGTGARASGCDDSSGHGTGVSGLATAIADNEEGIAGIAFDADLMALRACVDACFVVDIAAAISYAVDNGARVLNYSFAGSDSTALRDAVEYAARNGVLQVAAAGNEESLGTPADTDEGVGFPAAYEEVIAVAATDDNDKVASFSSQGQEVEVAAPGDDVLTTEPTGRLGDGYTNRDGTSFSSPHVTGLGALLMNLGANAEEARVAIVAGVDDIGAEPGAAGAGRINVARSIDIALAGEFTGSLSGTVTDAADTTPLEAATVTITDADGGQAGQATTGSQGGYAIDGLTPADYTVTAEAAGYEPASKDTTVTLGEDRSVNLALAPEEETEEADTGGGTAEDDTTEDSTTEDDTTEDSTTEDSTTEDTTSEDSSGGTTQTDGEVESDPAPATEPDAGACPPDEVPPAGFADVSDGNVHAEAIDCVAWYGISQGTSPSTYTPAGVTTRAQMAAFIARTMETAGVDLGAPGDQGFTDIAGHPQQRRINQLAAAGVVQGTTETTYTPQAPVTRAQMASFLVRAHERTTGSPLPQGESRFSDVSGNPHQVNIDKAAEAGWALGTTATTYDPGGAVRRDQQASFLVRMLDDLVHEGLASTPDSSA